MTRTGQLRLMGHCHDGLDNVAFSCFKALRAPARVTDACVLPARYHENLGIVVYILVSEEEERRQGI